MSLSSAEYMVCPDTCVPPEKRMPQEEKPDITMRMSKENAHDHQNVCVAFGGVHQPFYGGADGSFAFSTACSTPDRAADAPLDAALPPAVCAAVPDRAAV